MGNYHFLSGVIAGGFVGSSTAVLVVSGWELLKGRKVESDVGGANYVQGDDF
jgi:hypothetical protein